jgi:predicted lipoprotein with Yx(FWY)xxD motif
MNRLHNRPSAALALLALVASAALAGCGPEEPESTATATTTATATETATMSPSSTEAATVDLKTADSPLGEIVVDGNGQTLYYYTEDTKGSGTSACTGGCLEAWPIAVAAEDEAVADPSVTGTVGTIDSPDGRKQLTLNGMPLYYYAKDTAPGDVLGQGVNDVWYVVMPNGDMVKSAPASSK